MSDDVVSTVLLFSFSTNRSDTFVLVLLFDVDEKRGEGVVVVEEVEEEEEDDEDATEEVVRGSIAVGFRRVNCSGLSQTISSSLISDNTGRGRTKNGSKSTQKVKSDGSIGSFRPHL
jgi:hypothetical protein